VQKTWRERKKSFPYKMKNNVFNNDVFIVATFILFMISKPKQNKIIFHYF